MTAGFVFSSAAVLLVACGFPSPLLRDADGKGDSGFDASDEDVFVNPPFDPDAEVVEDAGQKVDTTNCDPSNCDCDGDGFNDHSKLGCADAGGPNDCDDSDRRLRPDQGFVDQPNPPRSGDWNCDGTPEPYYKNTNVVCGGLLNGAACVATEGFKDMPACGAAGQYVHCIIGGALNLGCVDGPIELKLQKCK